MKPLRLLLHLLVLSLLIGILLSWLLTTQSGSQFVVDEINSRTPITISGLKGALTETLQFTEIIMHDKSGEQVTKLSKVQLSLDFHSLLNKEIHINSIDLEKVEVFLVARAKAKDTDQKITLPEIELPWNIYLPHVTLNELLIHKAGSDSHKVSEIKLDAAFIRNQLNINDLTAKYQDIQGNLKGEIMFHSPNSINLSTFIDHTGLKINNQVHITGDIDNYSLSLNIDNKNQDFPFTAVTAESSGSLTELKDISGKIYTNGGDISITGGIKFKDELTAHLVLTGQHFDPSVLETNVLEKTLQGDLNISTSLNYANSRIEIKTGIEGTLQNYPLQMDLHALWENDWLSLQKATLNNGPNHIDIKGKINTAKKSAILEWDIDASSLETLYPASNGTITGAGTVNISTETLSGSGHLRIDNFSYDQHSLESMDIQFLTEQDKNDLAQQSVTINAQNIKSAGQLFENLTIQGAGSIENHHIEVVTTLPSTADISFKVVGGVAEKTWAGNLQGLDINSKEFGHFQQEKITPIIISEEKTSIDPVCLTYKNEKICTDILWLSDSTNKKIHITLSEIPISRFSRWVPQTEVIQDKVDAVLELNKLETGWSANAKIEIDEMNQFSINKLTLVEDAFNSGSIDFSFNKMVWLTLFSDSILRPKGVIKGSLKPRGSLSSPEIKGDIQLSNGGFLLPATGIEIININARAIMLNFYEAIIMGKASSGKGWLDFSGKAGWKQGINLSLSIGGKGFQVINSPDIKATASPDLTLVIKDKDTRLSGRILFPEVQVNVLKPPASVISVSEDEIIINQQKPGAEIKQQTKSTFVTDIDLLLGDNIRISGEGAEFKVSGNVKLHKTKNLPIQTFGKINIDEGTYQAYGQDLTIRKGEIYLAGLPDNPGLAIEAVREIKDITAGLMIRGTLKYPITTVFAEPAMPETEALSYLLTGRSLTETSTAENNILLNAVTKFGIKGSAGFVDNLKTSTGLSALEIQAGDDASDTSILLGKYLTPKLYIQYVKRLFDNQDTASMRYEMTNTLSLEAESGTSQGIDLIYEIETD